MPAALAKLGIDMAWVSHINRVTDAKSSDVAQKELKNPLAKSLGAAGSVDAAFLSVVSSI